MAAGVTARRFTDQVALVTGGGRGIGAAIARALAAEGAMVGVVARSQDQCDAVADEIGERGFALPGDITSPESCGEVVAEVADRFGRLDVLVNAAGISPVRGPAERQDVATFSDVVGVNLIGAFAMMRAAQETLSSGGGAVVNVASTLGMSGSPLLSAYGSSKAALIHLTRTLGREWAPKDVRVNALCPGYVETDLTARMLANDAIRNELLDSTPMRRLADMGEVVAPALFLASHEASYITGTTLLVDGGFSS